MQLPTHPGFSLKGQRALVTGAGRGIGLACAAALADAGANLVLAARTLDEIEQVARAVRDKGGEAVALRLDVSNISATGVAIAEYGPFDVLVNNAGTNRPKSVTEVSEDDFDAVIGLNLKAAYFVAKAVAEGLIKANRPGSLIHISSQMGHVGSKNRSLYCASKWGLEGMSKSLALDLARYHIRSNTIAPTFIETPLTKPYFENAAFKQQVLSKISLGRLGKVEDLMGAVTYLASPSSNLVTGTSLRVDGGWTAH